MQIVGGLLVRLVRWDGGLGDEMWMRGLGTVATAGMVGAGREERVRSGRRRRRCIMISG